MSQSNSLGQDGTPMEVTYMTIFVGGAIILCILHFIGKRCDTGKYNDKWYCK